jgi:hypothetical protein
MGVRSDFMTEPGNNGLEKRRRYADAVHDYDQSHERLGSGRDAERAAQGSERAVTRKS